MKPDIRPDTGYQKRPDIRCKPKINDFKVTANIDSDPSFMCRYFPPQSRPIRKDIPTIYHNLPSAFCTKPLHAVQVYRDPIPLVCLGCLDIMDGEAVKPGSFHRAFTNQAHSKCVACYIKIFIGIKVKFYFS